MAIANLPIWTIKPDWSGGVLERLEWLTTVLTSRTGAEQRIGYRIAPRRSFDLSFVLSGAIRSLFDLSVGRVGPAEWWVPLWHTGAAVGLPLATGATFCVTPTAGREWTAPGAALLLGNSPFDYEVAEVTAIGSGGITFGAGLSRSWGTGTRIYPLRRGRLAEQPKLTRRSESVAVAQARFLLTEPDDYTPLAWPDTYRGVPVLAARPDESQNLSMEYERLIAEFDAATGPARVVDLNPDLGLTVQQHAWFTHGAAEHGDFRALLHALQGRLVPVWMPTHSADLELVSTAAGGASAITVRECGYTAYSGIRPGRQDIRIELRSGVALHRRITASAKLTGGRESLTLDSPLTSPMAPADVRRISFMALSRLDQDAVEIAHRTDVAGVSTMVSAFRSTPESRIATAWTPQRSAFTLKTPWLCGTPADCSAFDAYAMALMNPSFTEYTESIDAMPNPDGTQGAPCEGGHRLCWYAGYRLAVTPDGWTPQLRAALATVPPYDPFGGNVFRYTRHLSGRLRNAFLAAADTGTSTSAPICGARILAVGEAHSAWARASLGADNLGRHVSIIAYSEVDRTAPLNKGVEIRDTNGNLQHHLLDLALTFGTYTKHAVEGGGWLFHAGFTVEQETVYYNIYNPSSPYRTQLDWYADNWQIPTTPFLATIPNQ